MAASWLISVVAMSIAIVPYYMAIPYLPNELVYPAGFAIPLIGAAAGAMVATRNRFKFGFSTVVPAIVVLVAFSYVAGVMGVGDNVGVEGAIVGTVLSLPFIVAASGVGALLGEWALRGRADA